MVRRVIVWKFKEQPEEAMKETKRLVKENLEGLKGRIPGIVELTVNIEGLASSNADAVLEAVFESEEALKAFGEHPDHHHVASTYVKPNVEARLGVDYLI